MGPALTLPLFDGGRLRAQLASDNADYDEMVARYNGLLLAALNDASDQFSALASVRKQIALEKRAQQDALKSWDISIRLIEALGGGYSDTR